MSKSEISQSERGIISTEEAIAIVQRLVSDLTQLPVQADNLCKNLQETRLSAQQGVTIVSSRPHVKAREMSKESTHTAETPTAPSNTANNSIS